MRVGRVYPSDREGKKIMMLLMKEKKIHAGAKGYGNYKGKGKNRGGTHTNKKRGLIFKSRHNCDQCKGRITTPKCLACKVVVNALPYELRVGKNGYYVVNTDTNKEKIKRGMSKSKQKDTWPLCMLIKALKNTTKNPKEKKHQGEA